MERRKTLVSSILITYTRTRSSLQGGLLIFPPFLSPWWVRQGKGNRFWVWKARPGEIAFSEGRGGSSQHRICLCFAPRLGCWANFVPREPTLMDRPYLFTCRRGKWEVASMVS